MIEVDPTGDLIVKVIETVQDHTGEDDFTEDDGGGTLVQSHGGDT